MQCAVARVVNGDLEPGVLPAPGESLPGFGGSLDKPAKVIIAGSHPPHLIREVRMEIRGEQIMLIPGGSGNPRNLLVYASAFDATRLHVQRGKEIARSDQAVLILLEGADKILVHEDNGRLYILPA